MKATWFKKVDCNHQSSIQRCFIPRDAWVYEEIIVENSGEVYKKSLYIYNDSRHMLPSVSAGNEDVLSFLNIPYEDFHIVTPDKIIKVQQYWNPSYLEYEEKTSPLYCKTQDGKYEYTGSSYTGLVPSEESVNAAKELSEIVNQYIAKRKDFLYAKRILEGNVSTIVFGRSDLLTSEFIEWNGEVIKTFILPVILCNKWVNLVAYFDLSKIWESELHNVNIVVPSDLKRFAGTIIGQNHWRANSWANNLSHYSTIEEVGVTI